MDVAVGAEFSLAAIAAVPFGVVSAGVSVNTPDLRAILLLVAEQSSRACTWNLIIGREISPATARFEYC